MPKNTDFTTSSWDFLGSEIKSALAEFNEELISQRESGLDEASDYLMKKLEDSTPVDTGETKSSWTRTNKYKGVRYINNTALTQYGKIKIPKLNIIEFSSIHGKPFVRKTFDESKGEIEKIIIQNFNKEK